MPLYDALTHIHDPLVGLGLVRGAALDRARVEGTPPLRIEPGPRLEAARHGDHQPVRVWVCVGVGQKGRGALWVCLLIGEGGVCPPTGDGDACCSTIWRP
jgi:hypothetical protein